MGQCQGHLRLYLINFTKINALKVAKFGSMDILELHGDILQPGGQLETPGLVFQQVEDSHYTCWKQFRAQMRKLFKNPTMGVNVMLLSEKDLVQ